MRDRRLQQLLARLSHPQAAVRSEALWELSYRRLSRGRLSKRQRDRALAKVAVLARTDPDPGVRRAAVHTFLWSHGSADPTGWLLETALADADASVRGHILEVLGVRWVGASPKARLYPEVVAAIEQGLKAEEGEVRFWALYAVASMRLVDLRPAVEGLTGDSAVGWRPRTVGQEARDVLAVLDGAAWGDGSLP